MTPQPKPGEGRTNRRRKELARAKEARQEARRADRDSARKRRMIVVAGAGIAAIVVIVAGIALWPKSEPTSTASDAATGQPSAQPSAVTPSASPSPSAQLAGCKSAPTPTGQAPNFPQAPKNALVAGTDYTLTLATNCGDIVIETLAKQAPQTVNSMLWLAGQKYFDNTLCHRLTTSGLFVLQCGDPTASGSGGPGYTVADENLPQEATNNYPAGTVAMANAGPGTAGSQFFIVYADTSLPASYTIWGKVTKGLDIVKEVAAAGVEGGGGDGAPKQPIGIITATPKPPLAS